MNVEVRATGLRAMREKKGLTQRELAHNLGISQNYIPALESGARRPGPKLRQALMKFFNVNFEDLFEVAVHGVDFAEHRAALLVRHLRIARHQVDPKTGRVLATIPANT